VKRGKFIVLEGLDGAGTTTQCEAIAKALRQRGHEVWVTREPSTGPIGVLIRQSLTGRLTRPGGKPLLDDTLAQLFAADRTDHVASEIIPALERGAVVLSDRYVMSSLAYQGSRLPMDWVATLNARALEPDLTLFVSVSLKEAARRRKARGGDAELFDAPSVQRKTARQYEKAIAVLRKQKQTIVEIDGDLKVAQVTALCLSALEKRLKL
jgi:dTMP kinase